MKELINHPIGGGNEFIQNKGRAWTRAVLQRPAVEAAQRIPVTRDEAGRPLYPELDADGDHVHFEMVPMGGDSILWLTLRRGITPELAATSLRKIADLIERHGLEVLKLPEGGEGSVGRDGELIP